MSPSLKAWMNSQIDEQRDDRERKKGKHSVWWDFFMVMILICGLAVWADQHREADMTAGVDRKAVMARQYDGKEDFGWWAARELFILRESPRGDTGRHLDKLHQEARR